MTCSLKSRKAWSRRRDRPREFFRISSQVKVNRLVEGAELLRELAVQILPAPYFFVFYPGAMLIVKLWKEKEKEAGKENKLLCQVNAAVSTTEQGTGNQGSRITRCGGYTSVAVWGAARQLRENGALVLAEVWTVAYDLIEDKLKHKRCAVTWTTVLHVMKFS